MRRRYHGKSSDRTGLLMTSKRVAFLVLAIAMGAPSPSFLYASAEHSIKLTYPPDGAPVYGPSVTVELRLDVDVKAAGSAAAAAVEIGADGGGGADQQLPLRVCAATLPIGDGDSTDAVAATIDALADTSCSPWSCPSHPPSSSSSSSSSSSGLEVSDTCFDVVVSSADTLLETSLALDFPAEGWYLLRVTLYREDGRTQTPRPISIHALHFFVAVPEDPEELLRAA